MLTWTRWVRCPSSRSVSVTQRVCSVPSGCSSLASDPPPSFTSSQSDRILRTKEFELSPKKVVKRPPAGELQSALKCCCLPVCQAGDALVVARQEENSFPEYSGGCVGDVLRHQGRQVERLPHPLAERNARKRSRDADRLRHTASISQPPLGSAL
ncbi:hypothetical protein EYF80_050892 [Liparis tanakae]|uniref:Uncharacterized protein n=1 Tax=Liparis tanakae TaxID=230148 RepID=A0A4Z2FEU1_9TELE|nr:hypothetical protein EYF80_050892 [Liparis tanakae]